MSGSPGVHQSLPGYGHWLVVFAAILAGLYGIAGDSAISLALAFQYVLMAVATWSVRDLLSKRNVSSVSDNSELDDAIAINEVTSSQNHSAEEQAVAGQPLRDLGTESLRAAVQFHAVILGGVSALIGLFALFQLLQLRPSPKPDITTNAPFTMICLAALVAVVSVRARSFQSGP